MTYRETLEALLLGILFSLPCWLGIALDTI